MTTDDWVKAAMADDSIVGHLLLHLNQPNTPSLPLDWSVRQRRSRNTTLSTKKPISTRASPTTPLSWTGATSVSGGGGTGDASTTFDSFDFEEDSSRLTNKHCFATSGSKVIGTSEATSSKRPRKKKTLAELKVEEDLLINERKYLNNKLESVRVNLGKQKTENESLKQIKQDLSLQWEGKTVFREVRLMSNKTNPRNTTEMVVECEVASESNNKKRMEGVKDEEDNNRFGLPDLNIAVEEEIFSS